MSTLTNSKDPDEKRHTMFAKTNVIFRERHKVFGIYLSLESKGLTHISLVSFYGT